MIDQMLAELYKRTCVTSDFVAAGDIDTTTGGGSGSSGSVTNNVLQGMINESLSAGEIDGLAGEIFSFSGSRGSTAAAASAVSAAIIETYVSLRVL